MRPTATGAVPAGPGSGPAVQQGRMCSRVDGEGVDCPAVVAPRRKSLLVVAARVERRERISDGLGEGGLGLGEDVAVRGGVVGLADCLELAAGLLDGVEADGGVGQHGVGLYAVKQT